MAEPDFNESDKAMLEAMGVHRVVRLLFEMRVLKGPVWGSDANGSLFLGWIEKDDAENVATAIDHAGSWGKQDLSPLAEGDASEVGRCSCPPVSAGGEYLPDPNCEVHGW